MIELIIVAIGALLMKLAYDAGYSKGHTTGWDNGRQCLEEDWIFSEKFDEGASYQELINEQIYKDIGGK